MKKESKHESSRSFINVLCNSDGGCGETWELYLDDFVTAKVLNVDENLEVRYFACPSCGKVFIVDIFDEKAQKLRDEFVSLHRRNEYTKAEVVRMQLVEELEKTKERYKGTFVLDSSGSKNLSFVPRFKLV